MQISDSRRTGFTLVELLVVISIIALLVSLLLPVLQSVRQTANGVVCLSNLKQIGVGFGVYHVDSNGYWPQQNPDSGGENPLLGPTWWSALAPNLNWLKPIQASPNAAEGTIGHCPSHTENPTSFSYRASGNPASAISNYRGVIMPTHLPPLRVGEVRRNSEKILVYEVHTIAQWPQASVFWTGMGKFPFSPGQPTHNDAQNFLFVDLHASSINENMATWDAFNTSPRWP